MSLIKLNEKMRLKGVIVITVRGRDGKVRLRKVIKNTITDAGKKRVAELMGAISTTGFAYVGIGSGTATASGLGNPIAYISATRSAPASYCIWRISYTATESVTVTEAVICESSTGGTVLSYQNFSGIVMVAGEILDIEWTISVS